MLTLGEKLTKACLLQRMTEKDLAYITSISLVTVKNVLSDKHRPHVATLTLMLNALGLERKDLNNEIFYEKIIFDKKFGHNFKNVCEAKCLTVQELSQISGVSRALIYRLNDGGRLQLTAIVKLLRGLDVSILEVCSNKLDKSNVRRNVQKLCKECNITQEELAFKVDVSIDTIRKFNVGTRTATIKKIAEELGVKPSRLMEPVEE